MPPDNNIILRVSLDEGDSEKRLAQLVLAIEATQQAQKDLTKARDLGTVSADEYAQQSVKLTNQLIMQRAEQTSLTKEVTKAAPETKKLGSALLDAAKSNEVLTGAVQLYNTAKEKYTIVTNLARAATAGEVTVLGALKLALLATGLGVFVLVLGSLVTFFTKTQAGADLLSRKLAAFGAAVRVVTNLAANFGAKLVAAADNPKQAFDDLLSFIGTNLLNRLKSFGVIIDAIRNRDFTKLTDGVIQLGTGITDATAKTKVLAAEMASAATAAEAIEKETQRIRDAERALNVQRDESRAKIESLKKLSDDAAQSVGVRAAAARQAAAIENQLLAEQLKLQDDKIRNLQASQALQKNLTTEDKDALAELRSERAKTNQESLTLQTELQNKINSLATESADKRIALRKAELDAEAKAIDRQLKMVQVGSNEELKLLQAKLQNSYQAELNVKGLTVKAKRAIDENYESNKLAQELDFNRKRLQAALQVAVDEGNAQLAQQRTTGADLLTLQTEQLENQRQLAIAGLAANADNTAKIAAINAQTEQQQRQLEFAQATKDLQAYLDEKRRIVEADYASGAIQEAEYQRRLAAIAKAGTDAQAVVNEDYRQDNTENQKEADANEIEGIKQHTAQIKQQEEAKQDVRATTVQAFQQGADLVIQAFGEESAAGQAALALKKILAIAEIEIGLEKQLAANAETGSKIQAIAPPYTIPVGIAYEVAADVLAVAAAAASVANVLKYQRGGIAEGPSHARGGIPLYHRGRPAGIEIEGGEPVLTAGVSRNPLLLSLASTVNQLAGGRALMPNFPQPRMALGGVSQPLILDQLRGQAGQGIDYNQLARALSKQPIYTKTQETMKSIEKVRYTQTLANN